MEAKPKKVLIFSLAYYPNLVGGGEIAIKEITSRISSEEFEFDLITPRFDSALPRFERIGNVNVYRVGPSKKNPTHEELVKFPLYLIKVLYPFCAFFKAIRLYRKKRYDFFWSMMAYAGFPIVFFRAFYKNVPYVLTLQEGDPISHIVGRMRIRIILPILRRVFRGPVITQVISNYLGEFSRSMGYKGDIRLIPNGVDFNVFSKRIDKEELKKLRRNLGFADDDKILITTSRLVGKNAVDDIIKSISFLPENIKFLVVGAGPDEAGLKSLTEQSGVANRTKFIGHAAHKELPGYLQISDVFIRPSIAEGFGNSFIEAMAAGIPVIATPVGGIKDFLRDRETGLFCDVRNPESIAQKVKELMEDDVLRRRVIDNGINMVRQKYDWHKISQEMSNLFKGV